MRRVIAALLSIALLMIAACTSGGPLPRDPHKVVLPPKRISVAGRLYATKDRTLYRFAGPRLTPLFKGTPVKDPAVTPDGARLAFAELQAQSSTIVTTDAGGQTPQSLTQASAPDGALWAFAPAFSPDGREIACLTDRGKAPSSPQNLQPNDLGIWVVDTTTGQSRRLVRPIAYTGGDSDPVFRPATSDQLIYTTYLYGGQPLQPVARLTWLSTLTGARVFLSPDGARNFQPALSPDGKFVAFIRADGSNDDLYVMPLAPNFTREPQPYPSDAAVLLQSGMVAQPVWSPDGSAIAFLMLVNGSFDLFILPLSTTGTIHAGAPPQAITHGSYLDADSRLAWSP
jgi:TolB protein